MNPLDVIPLPYRILALSLVAVAFGGFCWVQGADHVQDKWDAATLKQQVIFTRVKQRQAEITTQVVTQYVDRVKVVREKGEEIIREVPVYVKDDCSLSGGFRVLHDAAARAVNPEPASVADAATVPAQDIAETVAENYLIAHQCAEQLTALQDWVRQQAEIK